MTRRRSPPPASVRPIEASAEGTAPRDREGFIVLEPEHERRVVAALVKLLLADLARRRREGVRS